jgi:hypothetical protein
MDCVRTAHELLFDFVRQYQLRQVLAQLSQSGEVSLKVV